MELKAKLITENKCEIEAKVTEKKLDNGVVAVYISGKADTGLYSEHGADITLDIDNGVGMTALYRSSEFWCSPEFCDDAGKIPDETQMLVVKNNDGSFMYILPVVSEKYRCVLYGDGNGKAHARLFTWCDGVKECECLAFTYTVTDNPSDAAEKCFMSALKEMGKELLPRQQRKYPDVFEYLGWCSWDSMQIRVSEEGLIEKCQEFKEKNIPVRWAIIDDMWASIPKFNTETYSSRPEMFALMHSSPIADFEAEPKRFPNGLKHAITEMKKYMTWVGMWHPTTGYWFGIDTESELHKRFEKNIFVTADGRHIIKPTYEDYKEFLFAFHTFLKDCGSDFTKIDNQSIIRRFYKQQGTVGEMATAMHKAIDECAEHFYDGKLINCMGCASDNIWNRPTSPVSRCSDDFKPEDKEWFTKHILMCSYTCLLQGPVIYSDWDMWWSGDEQALKNSVIRAISGGPVYVSDEIGRSVREILMPLCLNDGKLLRCERPAVPTLDCFASDPRTNGKLFKIQNLCGTSGAVAAFNLDPDEVEVNGVISPDDVLGLEGEEFAVYEHMTGETFTMKKGETRQLKLKNRDEFKLYTFTPITDGFAVIGLKDKFMSPLSVKSVNGRSYELYEDGVCLVYSDGKFIER